MRSGPCTRWLRVHTASRSRTCAGSLACAQVLRFVHMLTFFALALGFASFPKSTEQPQCSDGNPIISSAPGDVKSAIFDSPTADEVLALAS